MLCSALLSAARCRAGLRLQRAAAALRLLALRLRAQAVRRCSRLFCIFTVQSVSCEAEVGLCAHCLFSEAGEFSEQADIIFILVPL